MGNFEYRMFLRCRHAAKLRFIKLRSDVLVKLQLLDNKRGRYGVSKRGGWVEGERKRELGGGGEFWRLKKVLDLKFSIHCCYWPPRSKWLIS